MKEFKTKIHYQLILVLFALIISMFPAKAYADELQPAEDYVETKEETPVTEAEWGLDKTELTVNIAMDSYGELHLTDLGDDMDLKNDFIIESSDPSVVAAEAADSCIALYYQHQGTAVITVTDKYGKSERCTVIVSAPDWSLMDNELKMIINH